MSATPAQAPGSLGVDALCELVNVGAGSAAAALSRLLGGATVLTSVPRYEPGHALANLVQGDPPGVMVRLSVGDTAPYTFFLLFEQAAARRFAARLLKSANEPKCLGQLEESALLELGNIMSCAFLDAAARLLGTALLPGPPVARYGGLAALLEGELAVEPRRVALLTQFEAREGGVRGLLLLLTTDEGAVQWAERLGVTRGA